MICSCQKQDSAAEQQLTQRKVELDARENALIEREKVVEERASVLDKREKALAENQKGNANARTTFSNAHSQDTIHDAAHAKTERDRRLQPLPPELQALIPDSSTAGKDKITKERLSEAQGALKELMNQKRTRGQMSGPAGSPATEAASPISSPTP